MLPFDRHKKVAVASGAALFRLSILSAVAMTFGIRINTSYSLPLGLYATTNDVRAELIEFCPVEPFASESASRSYRTPGFARPDGTVPLLKPIVARPGDLVNVSAEGISVNGYLLSKTYPVQFDYARQAAQLIKPSQSMDSMARLRIYQRSHWARLIDSL